MQKPRDLNDHSKCVQIEANRTMIYCVECNQWCSVELSGMAKVTVAFTGITALDFDSESIQLCCRLCGVNIEYLLNGQYDIVVQQLDNHKSYPK